MITIEVKGFQSAEDVNFVIDGFTAIVGRSNIGKSALVRALRYALTNAEGVHFVRHGLECARTLRGVKTCKCFSSVHIVMDDFDLLWEKGDSVYRYVFNGSEYDHPGKGIPEFLANNGVAPVKVGDESGCIQIANQFYPIFLLNQSGGVAAETISDVSKLTRINKATSLVEKDRRDAKATKKVREEDVDKLRIRLSAYGGLDEALQRVADVEGQFAGMEAKEGRLEAIKGYISKVTTLGLKIRGLNGVVSVVVPDLDAVEQLGPKVEQLSKFSDDYDRRTSDVSNLTWVEDLKVPDATPVTTLSTKLGQLSRFANEYERRSDNVEELSWVEGLDSKIPDTSEMIQLSSKVTLIDSWVVRLRTIKSKFDALDKVSKAKTPEIDPLQDLQKKLASLNGFISKSQVLQGLIRPLETELAQVEAEESTLEKEIQVLGVCPTCTTPLTLGHSHA